MNSFKFKTNIKCGGCIEKVSPHMVKENGIDSWSVNTSSPEKTLEVKTSMNEQQVIELVSKAGFQAEPAN